MSKEIQNVKIYACGGAGTSIVRELRNQVDCKEIVNGFSGYQVTYVNTSESDFRDLSLFEKQLKEWGDTAYFYKGIDGSGKNQTENLEVISESPRTIVKAHPPLDLNLVVFSGIGGSGSVIGPALINHLLSEGKSVIGICISGMESGDAVRNSASTYMMLQDVATANKKPVVLAQFFNENRTIKEVNAAIMVFIIEMTSLMSVSNTGIDSKDLANWLNYTLLNPALEPGLASIVNYRINSNTEDGKIDDVLDDVISVMSLVTKGEDAILTPRPSSQNIGLFETPSKFKYELHSAILLNHAADRFDELAAAHEEDLERASEQAARSKRLTAPAKPKGRPLAGIGGISVLGNKGTAKRR